MYKLFLKRSLDVVVALGLLIVASPVLLIIAIVLPLATRESAFFFQTRPGKHGQLFRLVKFKTMSERRDTSGALLPDAERMTSAGLFLRKTSLDELPQLFNVLSGDMSLIGPRPLLVEYLPLYSAAQARRHEVLPGITGWAQVNGRNSIGWDEKFAYDVWYVDHLGLATDLKIGLQTVAKVLRKEGINAESEVTMEPFRGQGL